jgi:hypothetical protein
MRKVIAALLLAPLLVLGVNLAGAQTKKPATTTTVSPPICDPLNLIPGCKQSNGTLFSAAVNTDISNFLIGLADIAGAQTLSTQIPGLQDPVGNACWSQLGPVQALIKLHPLPATLKVASDIEALRLAAIAMNQVCANPNCGQMFVDATNAAAAISGAPIPVSVSSLCAKVPVIGTSAVPMAAPATPALSSTMPLVTLPISPMVIPTH